MALVTLTGIDVAQTAMSPVPVFCPLFELKDRFNFGGDVAWQ